jgi:hypothetical protein
MTGSPPLGPGYTTGTKHQLVDGHGPTPVFVTITISDGAARGATLYPVHGRSGPSSTAWRLYGIRRLHVPMQPRHCLFSPSGGFGDAASQKPLRATCRPSKTASSISEEGRAFRREHSPRNRDRSELVIGNQQRIGSVRCRLGTWAASAAPSHAKPRSTARRPIKAYEVEPSAHMSPQGIGVPDQDPLWCARSFAPQFGTKLATPGRGWFNWCP